MTGMNINKLINNLPNWIMIQPVNNNYKVGLISDTHGVLPKEALEVFQGVSHIVHAGDVGAAKILYDLERVAPVTVVRGNTDRGPLGRDLENVEVCELAGIVLYVLHDLETIDLQPAAADVRVVVSGHTHRPSISNREHVLYINPGSASEPRFGYCGSVGILSVRENEVSCEIIELKSQKRHPALFSHEKESFKFSWPI